MAESRQGPVGLGRRVGHVTGRPRAYRAVVYDKGALVAHMLRRLAGDAAFFSALRELQVARRFSTATTGDLSRALEHASGIDLAPFFDLWIGRTEIPRIAWDWASDGNETLGYLTRVRIGPTGLPGPVWLEVTLTLEDGRRRMRIQVPSDGGTVALPTAKRPRGVSINEDWAVLARLRRDGSLID
jgi:aminopeptidase N